MPTLLNINPCSIYNKSNELKELLELSEVHLVCMSESWERENEPLHEMIKIEGHQVISNPFQRHGRGGRPALIINEEKYFVQNLTNSVSEEFLFINSKTDPVLVLWS